MRTILVTIGLTLLAWSALSVLFAAAWARSRRDR
jgi:hypothetical protein